MELAQSSVFSFLIGIILIPIIIKIVKAVDLLDQPDRRKLHHISTPSLGGIAIYLGMFLALFLNTHYDSLVSEKYFLGGIFLIFLLGIRDDISGLQASHKLTVQIFAAVLIVVFMGVKIHGLNGLFGIDSFGWYFDEIFTIATIVVLTNAFNLIDGIDGLAGSVGLVLSSLFTYFFYSTDHIFEAILASSLAGALLAFLIYNWYPSKIFMGDTGSLVIGFTLTILLVKFLGLEKNIIWNESPVSLMMACFILPVYDTLRVFIFRLIRGKHPLAPDQNHIHHVMLRLGYNHGKVTLKLVSFNVLLICLTYYLQTLGEICLILSIALTTFFTGFFLDKAAQKKEKGKTVKLVSLNVGLPKSA